MQINHYVSILILGIFLLPPRLTYTQVLFQTGQSLSTPGSWFEVVAVGDINNDSLNDIVAATSFYFDDQFDYKLFVYIQSASGTFPTTQYYSYPEVYPGLRTIGIDDINNDSLNDIVIGYADSIAIFFQNETGSLNPSISFFSGNSVQDVKIADINNDTLNDIVVAHSESYIRAFYQTKNGLTSSIYAKPPSGGDELEIGDLNADGLNDVVLMIGAFDGGIHVFAQNTEGTLNNYVSYFSGGSSFNFLNGIAVGDLNNDGYNDVAASKGGNRPNASLVIWYQDTTTKLLQQAIIIPAYEIPSAIEVADFNCDGKLEIFMTHGGWDAITVWSQNVAGNYTDYDIYPVSVAQHPSPEGLTSGDINSDGKPDIVAVGNFTTIQLLYNISIPTDFTHIDTSIVIDTITHYYTYSDYFTITMTHTTSDYIITQTDSFIITYSNRQDSVRTDSIISRTGILCDSIYMDVILSAHYWVYETETIDTSLWSTTTDTTFIVDVLLPKEKVIKIFPNPFSSHIHIELTNNDRYFVALYDFLGLQVFRQYLTNSTKINTEAFAPGNYFYTL